LDYYYLKPTGLVVAVKTLKDTSSVSNNIQKELLDEAQIMIATPYHPNIVTMLGMTLNPLAIVVEFIEGPGALKRFVDAVSNDDFFVPLFFSLF
jgi:serine/threonine protein kinase